MAAFPDRLEPGASTPLGATWDGLGINFAVFSAHARQVELCIFDQTARRETARFRLPECTDEVWHGYLPGARIGLIYGYRAYGPYNPQEGIASTTANCCLIRMQGSAPEFFAGRTHCSATAFIRREATFLTTAATVPKA